MVFQDYALFPHLTVGDNVGFGLPRRERGTRVAEALALVGLDGYESRYPHQLSGGQQQRVALARALAPKPALVLLDEPWSNIDPHLRASMREQLSGILRGVGVTVILVTHDREEAFSLADRIALMRGGTLVQDGSAEDLYFAPSSRWAAEFAGEGNFIPGEILDGHVQTELGTFPAPTANGTKNVHALIRPELLELRPDPAGVAEVVSREFRGHDVFYRVRLNGYELVSLRPSTEAVPLGSKVAIRPHRVPVPVFD
jgi:iron(III) transport system ATP-binding protein